MDVLWILTGVNSSAVLLWDLWGVISVSQLVSSLVEISDIHIPFSKHCQGNDLLSTASFMSDAFAQTISKKLKWEIGVPIC